MEDEPDYSFLDRVHTDKAKEWARNRAATSRRKDINIETRLGYEMIQFPNQERCRHAALVICGRFAEEPAVALEILEALALPTIIREGGGDGRVLKVQKKPLKSTVDPPPPGYRPEDYGRPDARPSRGKWDRK